MSPQERFSMLNSFEEYELRGKNLPETIKKALQEKKFSFADPKSGAVLLTGARGFLGNFLLYELLTKSNLPIYCIVRSHGNKRNERKN